MGYEWKLNKTAKKKPFINIACFIRCFDPKTLINLSSCNKTQTVPLMNDSYWISKLHTDTIMRIPCDRTHLVKCNIVSTQQNILQLNNPLEDWLNYNAICIRQSYTYIIMVKLVCICIRHAPAVELRLNVHPLHASQVTSRTPRTISLHWRPPQKEAKPYSQENSAKKLYETIYLRKTIIFL